MTARIVPSTRACGHAEPLAREHLAAHITRTLPAGRDQALAITKVEEAMFWTNAGIAREPRETTGQAAG